MTTSPRTFVSACALALFVISPLVASAQTTYPVVAGVEAGINASELKSETDVNLTRLYGGTGGVFVGRNFTPNFGMRLEALFSQRGAKDDVAGADAHIRLHYLDIPVLARFGNTATNDMHYHIFTGPQGSIRLKSEVKDNISGVTADLDDETKSYDIGWTLGAGVEVQKVSFDVRYTMGLVNINKTDSGDDYKNRTFTLMLGYRFR